MSVVVGVAVFSLLILVGLGICLAVGVDTNKLLNEQKSLRLEMADIKRQMNAIGPNPTHAQLVALNTRVGEFRKRLDAFEQSPFVITARNPAEERWL